MIIWTDKRGFDHLETFSNRSNMVDRLVDLQILRDRRLIKRVNTI